MSLPQLAAPSAISLAQKAAGIAIPAMHRLMGGYGGRAPTEAQQKVSSTMHGSATQNRSMWAASIDYFNFCR